MPILSVIFDMDGLMFDSEAYYRIAMNEAFRERGLYADQQIFDSTIGMNMADTSIALRQIPGYTEVEQQILPRIDELLLDLYETRGVPIKPGLFTLLDYLHQNEHPIGLATSTIRRLAEPVLQQAGVNSYFRAMVFGDMVKNGKPAPDIYLLAAEKLNAKPSRCLVLEDSIAGVQAAASAGMRAIMVPDSIQPDAATRARALAVCDTLADAIPLLADL